ncbi:VOC family protein [Rapidithrix thailandica]|uniref:VOC family protein n=1 Tax=Rapidithrix thailandica TaxID=413964 RepID=A0AAW9S3N5_9BACT
MNRIITYLTFNGNCRCAMEFYHECLGGELHLQTLGDSPLNEELPESFKNCVVQASLKINDLVIMGTDMVEEQGLVRGNAMSMLIDCNSELEMRDYYEKLSEGGQSVHPIEKNYWGALFGGLIDKFGNRWLFNFKFENTLVNGRSPR